MRRGNTARPGHRRRALLLLAGGVLAASPAIAEAAAPVEDGEVPLAPVVEEVLAGDLVMAANSNLVSAGGWRHTNTADVDRDATRLCLSRRQLPLTCADNSSSALLDIPDGARVVHARLYVQTSLSSAVGPVRFPGRRPGRRLRLHRARLDRAGEPEAGRGLRPQRARGTGAAPGGVGCHRARGRRRTGTYTVADIVHERAGAFLPYASWAIVAAYELDPAADLAVVAPTPEAQQRFARRAVTWHDGFVTGSSGTAEMPVGGFTVDPAVPVFAKSFHIIGHAQHLGAENLLFDGMPIGNNVMPGDPADRPG